MPENSSNNQVEDIFDSVDEKNVDRGSRIADPQSEAGNRNASLYRSLRSDDSGRDDKGGKNDFPLRSSSFEGQVGRDDKGGEVGVTRVSESQGEGGKKSGIKNIIIIVAIMIGAVVVIGGIVFAVQSFMNRTQLVPSEGQLSDLGMPNSNDEVRVPVSVVADDEEETKTSVRDDDTDGDGLSNSDELKYKTNLNKVDTDDDGLFDGEEVNFFKTNPTNPDTDGDGFLDGEEVRYGFDPNGDGKLLNFEEALEKLKK